MPFVGATDALNAVAVDLLAEASRHGPGPWRVPLVGDPGMRVALIGWPPGYESTPHHHPHAPEIFEVVEGRLAFRLDALAEVEVEPGTLLLAARGRTHGLRVIGERPLVFVCALGPNLDVPDETIDQPGYWSPRTRPSSTRQSAR